MAHNLSEFELKLNRLQALWTEAQQELDAIGYRTEPVAVPVPWNAEEADAGGRIHLAWRRVPPRQGYGGTGWRICAASYDEDGEPMWVPILESKIEYRIALAPYYAELRRKVRAAFAEMSPKVDRAIRALGGALDHDGVDEPEPPMEDGG